MPVDFRILELYTKDKNAFMIYSIVSMIKPKIILEMGSGMLTSAALLALSDLNEGKLYTIDKTENQRTKSRNHSWSLEKYWEYLVGNPEWNKEVDILIYNHPPALPDLMKHVKFPGGVIIAPFIPSMYPEFESVELPQLSILVRVKPYAAPEPVISAPVFQAEAPIEVAIPVRRRRGKRRPPPENGT